ncbi:hypothetical protein C5167_049099 [Papaver somniferum]|uniref:Uncharacterized protein n=1 Tax=Papaver somniferum TaxID=3469 RepID=A0A4Y7KNV2_PAPSO|nr:hypothetical protein C5167_049099 [Papaver somniferum]
MSSMLAVLSAEIWGLEMIVCVGLAARRRNSRNGIAVGATELIQIAANREELKQTHDVVVAGCEAEMLCWSGKNAEMVSKEDPMLLQNKESEVVLDEDGIAVGIGAMLVTVKYKEEKRLQLGFKQSWMNFEATNKGVLQVDMELVVTVACGKLVFVLRCNSGNVFGGAVVIVTTGKELRCCFLN